MKQLVLNKKIARNPKVAFTHMDNDLVLMGPDDDQFYSVNPTGTKIWSLLEFNSYSLHEICHSLLKEYDVAESTCRIDALAFIETMVAKNILLLSE